MGHCGQFYRPCSCDHRIVVTCHRQILRHFFPDPLQHPDHFHRDLVVVADHCINRKFRLQHHLYHHRRFYLSVFCMKPHHQFRLIGHSCFLQCFDISFVTFCPLAVICFENTGNLSMPCIDQIFCQQVCTFRIIQKDRRFIFHLQVAPLDKDIRDAHTVELLIQRHISAQNLAFAGFYDQSVHILGQDVFEALCFFLPAVSCIFQYDTVPLFRQYPIHPLDQTWKNVIGNISRNHCNIFRILPVRHPVGTESSFAMFCCNVSACCQNRQCFSHCMAADLIFLRQFIFRWKLFAGSDLTGKNLTFQFFHQEYIFSLFLRNTHLLPSFFPCILSYNLYAQLYKLYFSLLFSYKILLLFVS